MQWTIKSWFEDQVSRQTAALAYYGILSLSPLLIVAITVAALFFGRADIQQEFLNEANRLLGSGSADLIQTILNATYSNDSGLLATLFSLFIIWFSATNIFLQLKMSLNVIWHVENAEDNRNPLIEGLVNFLWGRLVAAIMVVGLGFALFLSQILGTSIAILISLTNNLPIHLPFLLQSLNTIASTLFTALIISLVFRFLPDKRLAWKDVWIGSLFTALLFLIGQNIIRFYLSHSNVASAYGVTGSLIVLLLWIYYSANILLFGAEFTQAYAHLFGSKAKEGNR